MRPPRRETILDAARSGCWSPGGLARAFGKAEADVTPNVEPVTPDAWELKA